MREKLAIAMSYCCTEMLHFEVTTLNKPFMKVIMEKVSLVPESLQYNKRSSYTFHLLLYGHFMMLCPDCELCSQLAYCKTCHWNRHKPEQNLIIYLTKLHSFCMLSTKASMGIVFLEN